MSQRLPIDERVEAPPGMRLMPRDIEVVKAVYEYRFLLRDQIQRLFFPSRNTANYRLQLLYQHGYLQRVFAAENARRNVRNTQAIYCLDAEGANLLVSELGIPREKMDWHSDRNEVKDFFIEHLLKINDFRIALTLAAQERGDQIVVWVPDWKLRDLREKVKDPRTGRTYPVAPDAYFIYELGDYGKRAHFFLELDRATMDNRRFAQKVRAYILYMDSGAYKERYRTQSLRVLTVVPSHRRLQNLKKTTEKAGGREMFWFTTFEQLDEAKILGSVWQMAGERKPVRLLAERTGGQTAPDLG